MSSPLPGRLLHLLASALAVFSLTLSLRAADPTSGAVDEAKAAITKSLNDFLTFNTEPAQHDRWWAEDLVYTTSAGLVKTKPMIMQAFVDAAKPGAPKAEPRAHYSAEDVLVRIYGDTAALTFRLVARNADGTVATFRNSGTLLRRSGKWQVITWQATKEPTPAK